ncbi:MAG TPA: HAMP domain-containing protein, partial [Candidatus Limnocylindrales bacterium]|nr:HAMP domain-containing protein [Candidatus Limnocylindrales bacterium]
MTRFRPLRLRFGTQLRLSMLVAALVPLAAFGTLAISRVQQTISADAEARVSAGSAAVQAILARDGAALLTTVQSYAGWDVLADEVAADDDAAISDQVLDFQVGGGEVDVAVLLVGEADLVASGPPAETAGLAAALGRLDDATANDGQVGLVPLADGVYQVAVERVDLGSRTGPGIEAAGTAGARLAFGRRLGPALALDARKLTGFDIAIFDVRGQPLLAGDLPTAKGFAPATPPPAGRLTLEHDGSAVAGLETLRGTDGAVIGTLATITDLGVLGAVSDAVLPVLAIALGLAAILALALAIYLGERLRGRVAALETGIRQVAAGDLSVRLPADGRDELAELAASH